MGRLGLLLLLMANGCVSTWQVQGASPEDIVAATPSRQFLVKRTDGTLIQLRSGRIEADSLVGIELEDPTGPEVRRHCAIALADIAAISVRERNKAVNTVLIVAGITLLAYAAILGAAMSGMET